MAKYNMNTTPNTIPNFFVPIVDSDMMAEGINASLREAIVGVVIANTACNKRIDVTEYEKLITEAKRFADAISIIILKDDKKYKEISFGRNNDMSTMKSLLELLNFFNSTEAYYENNYNTIIDRKSYSGFYYKSTIGDISVVCHTDADFDF